MVRISCILLNCIRIMSYNDDWLAYIFMQDVLNLLKKPVLSITGENGLFIVFRKVKNLQYRERERDKFKYPII